jgi:quinol monooxygenase YgiN
MFMRLLQVKVKTEELQGLGALYEKRIIPSLQTVGGCLYAVLMQSMYQTEEAISMTLWHSEDDALKYEHSGLFMRLVAEARPFFAKSTELKLQLSKDFTVELTPVSAEPSVKTYSVAATSDRKVPSGQNRPQPFLRIVSLHFKPGKFQEYKELHEHEIIPALVTTKGCQFACLSVPTAESNEAISVTLWSSHVDADEYERGGRYAQLLEKVKHTLSDLSQWNVQSAGTSLQSTTSEDVEIQGFHLVAGRSFLS